MKQLLLASFMIIHSLNINAQLNLNKGTVSPRKYYQELNSEFVNGKILMEAEIGGSKSKFILDTGAPLCITQECQEKNNYQLLYETTITDANGLNHQSKIVNVKEFKIGDLIYRNIPALVVDLKSSVLECFGVDGLIGSNLLRFGAVQIDWKNQKVILSNSYKNFHLQKADGEPLLVNDVQSSPYLTVSINAKITDRLLIDTGSDDFYSFTVKGLDYVQSKGYLKEAVLMKSNGSSSVGLYGSFIQGSDKLVKIDSLTIGKMAHLHGFHTVTTNDDQSRIGVYLLRQGLTTIDYPNELFFFKLYNSDFKYEYVTFGFDFIIDNKKIIAGSVWIDSDAEKKGLSVGDEIIDIEGFNLPEKDICQAFFELKKFIKDQQSIKLQYRQKADGQIKQIELSRMKL